MLQVEVFNGNIDAALRGLAKKIGKDGIARELRLRNRSHKKADRKKFKAFLAKRRRVKMIARRGRYDRGQ